MWLGTWDTAPFQTSMSPCGTGPDELSTTYSYKTDTTSACRNTDDTEGRGRGREGERGREGGREGDDLRHTSHQGIIVDPY